MAQLIKNLPAIREILVQSLGLEDPLEKGKATHSSILAWRIPWSVFHGVAKSRKRLSDSHFHFTFVYSTSVILQTFFLSLCSSFFLSFLPSFIPSFIHSNLIHSPWSCTIYWIPFLTMSHDGEPKRQGPWIPGAYRLVKHTKKWKVYKHINKITALGHNCSKVSQVT